MSFGDLQTASRMRDVVESIALKVVNRERPDHRIGRVNNFNTTSQQAWVLFPGESEETLVKARFGRNMIPTKSIVIDGLAEADIVRVAGRPGNYWIVDFLKGVPGSDYSLSVADAASKAYVDALTARLDALEAPTPYARGYKDAQQTIPHNAWTPAFSGESQTLIGGMVYNGPSYTVPEDGLYDISAQFLWTINSTGYRAIRVLINSIAAPVGYRYSGNNNSNNSSGIDGTAPLLAGDAIEIHLYQNSGASLTLNTNTSGFNRITIAKAGNYAP